MKRTFQVYGGNAEVSFNDTKKLRDEVFEAVLQYYIDYKHSGEGIMQDDDAQIYAPQVLSDIADDIFKFKLKWKNE